jgi:hypothetical protein
MGFVLHKIIKAYQMLLLLSDKGNLKIPEMIKY